LAKQQVQTSALRTPNGHFAQAISVPSVGRLVFISGMTARRPDGSIAGVGDIKAQTRQVCANLQAAVEAAGGSLDDICRVDVYVRDIADFEAIHEVRREFFTGVPPASTMVEVSDFVSREYLIEINGIAVIGG
jgi:enamine deaminase RidA (YjgF/YER057c/UK114 family)